MKISKKELIITYNKESLNKAILEASSFMADIWKSHYIDGQTDVILKDYKTYKNYELNSECYNILIKAAAYEGDEKIIDEILKNNKVKEIELNKIFIKTKNWDLLVKYFNYEFEKYNIKEKISIIKDLIYENIDKVIFTLIKEKKLLLNMKILDTFFNYNKENLLYEIYLLEPKKIINFFEKKIQKDPKIQKNNFVAKIMLNNLLDKAIRPNIKNENKIKV